MSVNLAAFSLHRYERFVGHLARAGALGRFYYSHRLSTDHRELGLAREQAVNLFPPAYLAGLHMRIARPIDTSACYDTYSALWQTMVLRRWRPAAILQAVIGYRVERLIRRAKSEGAVVLANVVTPHWNHYLREEREEYERLGLDGGERNRAMTENQARQYGDADAFLVDSRYSRQTLVDAGIAGDRISVIPPGADTDDFTPPPADQRDNTVFRVVLPARLDPIKGHRYLLEAWRRLALPNAELVFIGGATAAESVILSGFEGMAHRIPQSPFRDVAALMRRASVVVLPSVCEGWGQVVPEALASGVPVVVTRNAGAADCVRDGWNGFVVPARDPDALASALETLYRDRERRAAMALAARESAEAMGGWDRYAERLLALYAVLAPGGGR